MSMLNEARRGSITDDRDRSFMGRVREIVPWKGDDIKEIIRKLVYITAIGVLVYSAYDAYIFKFGSKSMIDDQHMLSELYNNPTSSTAEDQTPSAQPAVSTAPDSPDSPVVSENNPASPDTEAKQPVSKYPAGMLPNFEKLYDINPDIVGWIRIDGLYVDEDAPEDKLELAVDYPVFQGEDNDFYLEHDFSKAEANYGSIYADYRATVAGENRSDNVTLYGHDMASGRYFAKLHEYNKKSSASFVREHRLVNFSTLFEQDQYIIFACYLVSVNEKDDNQPIFRYHNVIDFGGDLAKFDYWYKNVMYRNYYITDIDCDINDQYLSLSTCAYEMSDTRFVVVARKLREGEDPSVYSYRTNPKKHLPEKYYTAFGLEMPKDDGPDYEYYIPE